jgi:hypothetical protein
MGMKYLKTWLKFTESTEYPNSFNIGELYKLRSFADRKKYCDNNLTLLGAGSSRRVYAIDETKVLKLASNAKGILQNQTEIQISNSYAKADIFPEVFDYHKDENHNHQWLVTERARKATKSDFKKIVGYDFDTIVSALMFFQYNLGRGAKYPFDEALYKTMWETPFMYELFDYIGSYDIPVGDMCRMSSYGVIKRDGAEIMAVVDYGLTKEIAKIYNKPRRKDY